MLLVPAIGFACVALGLLMLNDLVESTRLRDELSQYAVIAIGGALAIYGIVLVVNGRRGRDRLLELNDRSVHVQEAWRRVEIELDSVRSFRTARKQHRLVVSTSDGRRYSPILQPDGSSWVAVAEYFDRCLREHGPSA